MIEDVHVSRLKNNKISELAIHKSKKSFDDILIFSVTVLSEQEKVAYLEKKIMEVKRDKTVDAIVVIVSIITIFVGIIAGISGFSFLVFVSAYGIYLFVRHTRQSNKLVKELEKMNRIIPNPPCLNCGKELPNKDYEFCPFCGKSIKY